MGPTPRSTVSGRDVDDAADRRPSRSALEDPLVVDGSSLLPSSREGEEGRREDLDLDEVSGKIEKNAYSYYNNIWKNYMNYDNCGVEIISGKIIHIYIAIYMSHLKNIKRT